MSSLYFQGPVVYPMSPARAMSAKVGCQLNNGRFLDGGKGCSVIHCFPFTGPGLNKIPSSAMKAMNDSRMPLSSDILAKARSVSTIDCKADCAQNLGVNPKNPRPKNARQINLFTGLISRLRVVVPH